MGKRRAVLVAAGIALAAATLRLLPHLWGYRYASPERVFLGLGYLVGDFRQYAALTAQARDSGALFLCDEFTTAPSDGRFLVLFASLAGWLARLTGGSVILASHALQLVAILAFFALLWRFLGHVFPRDGARLRAFVLVAVSGGLEWLLWGAGGAFPPAGLRDLLGLTWPVRSWNTFEGLFAPHAIAAYAVVLAIWNLTLDGARGRASALVLAALLVPVTYAFHGYTAFFLAGSLGVGLAIAGLARLRGKAVAMREVLGLLALAAAFVAPLALNLWQLQDPVYAAVFANAVENDHPAPPWIWPLTFGLLLPLAALGVPALRARGGPAVRLLAAAAIAAAVLSVLPSLSPSRFPLFLHLPLAVAAAAGLESLSARLRPAPRRAAAALLWPALVLTNVFVVEYSLAEVGTDANYYLAPDEVAAAEALRPLPRGGVLAGAASSTYLPWLSRKPAYLGHWFMTPDMPGKVESMRAFFEGRGDTAQRLAFLRENAIRYVFVGPRERSLGRLDPALPLVRVIEQDGVQVYELRDEPARGGGS
jgi:hypothetical protein